MRLLIRVLYISASYTAQPDTGFRPFFEDGYLRTVACSNLTFQQLLQLLLRTVLTTYKAPKCSYSVPGYC